MLLKLVQGPHQARASQSVDLWHPDPLGQEPWGWDPAILGFNNPSRWFWYPLKCLGKFDLVYTQDRHFGTRIVCRELQEVKGRVLGDIVFFLVAALCIHRPLWWLSFALGTRELQQGGNIPIVQSSHPRWPKHMAAELSKGRWSPAWAPSGTICLTAWFQIQMHPGLLIF